jgi:TrmH family RNA methyltransferase
MAEISEELARYIGDTASPQGIFSVCKMLDNCCTFDTISKNKKYLALEDMQDPTNLGTVIRTAEALGLDGLLLSAGCCDLYNPKVLRGSMGGVFRLPVYMVGDMEKTIIALQNEHELCCYACVVDTDATPLHQINFTSGSVCVIGNEGNGLRDHTIDACSHRLTIRMPGRAESLNASMAAGIVMWEMVR